MSIQGRYETGGEYLRQGDLHQDLLEIDFLVVSEGGE